MRLSIWAAPCGRCRSAVRSEGIGLRRHRFFARKSGEKTREGAHPPQPRHRKPDNRPTARAAQRSACSFLLRLSIWTAPCSRCRSAVGSEGISLRRHRFFARKSGRKTREGAHPLNPAIGSLTIGRLHALCKILPAASCCGFRFGLLLAAAAALRRGFGHFLAGG